VVRGTAAMLGAIVFASSFCGMAGAEEATRASYREAAEPICKANTKANERILAGVRGEVRRDELVPAARRFRRAAKALAGTLPELEAVPRPAADDARLSRWFSFIATEVTLFERTAGYLAAGKKTAAQGMVVRLEGTGKRANIVVIPFEFHYCRFEPSRFT
jgi:hypothetical protein